jgi:hypothetical protein
MSALWQIASASVPIASLASLGFSSCRLDFFTLSQDTMALSAGGRDLEADPLFPWQEAVTLYKDGAPWFTGKADHGGRDASGARQSHSQVIRGPWWDLERLPYQQAWMSGSWETVDGELTWVPAIAYKSRYILGQAQDGTALTTGQVITEVLEYAIDCGVAVQIGTIDAGNVFPWAEDVDLTCAAVIQRVARWTPDMVGCFDYSTTPPTFNMLRTASCPSVSVRVGSSSEGVSAVNIARKQDTQCPGVYLIYERTDTVNGAAMEYSQVDAYPEATTGREIGALVQTLQLAGSQANIVVQKQTVKGKLFPTNDAAWLTWWRGKIPWLDQMIREDAASGSVHDTMRIIHIGETWADGTFTRELVEGTVQDWMSEDVETSDEEISALVDFEIDDADGNVIERKKDVSICCRVRSVRFITQAENPTDAAIETLSRTFQKGQSSVTFAEAVPTGLAQAFYTALNTPVWQGTITTVKADVDGTLRPGKLLNVSGGASDWAFMSALIQHVTEDIARGRTSVDLGAPDHLTVSDMLDLLRQNRLRKPASRHLVRTTGASSDSGLCVELGSKLPLSDSGAGPGTTRLLRIVDVGSTTKTILLDPQMIPSGAGVLQPREIQVCVDGVAKTVCILMSDPY